MPDTGDGIIINVKLPLFKDYARDPHAWFRQADAKFEIGGVKENRTKAAYVSSCLDASHDALIAHISLGDKDPYASMKEALIAACGSDVRQRVGDLVAGQKMGAETPLHFLARIETRERLHGGRLHQGVFSAWTPSSRLHPSASIPSYYNAVGTGRVGQSPFRSGRGGDRRRCPRHDAHQCRVDIGLFAASTTHRPAFCIVHQCREPPVRAWRCSTSPPSSSRRPSQSSSVVPAVSTSRWR